MTLACRQLFVLPCMFLVFNWPFVLPSQADAVKLRSPHCAADWGETSALVAMCEENQRQAKARFQSRADLEIGSGQATDYAAWSAAIVSSPVARSCLEQGLAEAPPDDEPNWQTIEDCVLQELRPSYRSHGAAWDAIPRETIRSSCGVLLNIRSFDNCLRRMSSHALESAVRSLALLNAGQAQIIHDALSGCSLAQIISDLDNSGRAHPFGFDGVAIRLLRERASTKLDQDAAVQCVREAAILIEDALHEPIFDVCYLKRTDPRFAWLADRPYRVSDAWNIEACRGEEKDLDAECALRRLSANELECTWLERNGRDEIPDADHVLALKLCKLIDEELSFDARLSRLDLDRFSVCLTEVVTRRNETES